MMANGHGMIGRPPKSHAPLAEAPTSQDLCRFCLSAGFTTSVWDEQAPHHTTKVMMAPHIANGHGGMIGRPPKSHAPLAEAPTSQDLCRCAEVLGSPQVCGMSNLQGHDGSPHRKWP